MLCMALRLSIVSLILGALVSMARADFTVQTLYSSSDITNLTEADALIAGQNLLSSFTTTSAYIDFTDPDNSAGDGNFSGTLAFSGETSGANDNNLVVHATTQFVIPTAGIYTFGVSSDDGSRLRIDSGSGLTDVIVDDSEHSFSDRFATVTFSSSGVYSLDFVYFEHAGVSGVELYAAPGTFSSFDRSFQRIGDTANGGLSTNISSVAPEPASLLLLIPGLVAFRRRKK